MRSFTNRRGEEIRVSESHLDTAIEIKLQLQKLSPSGRCSWATLVRMMKEEGFAEAESSESYRCLIKDYQKSVGKLPSVEKHADMISDNKLKSIKNAVGELAYAKRDAQNEFRELGKLKRSVIDSALFLEELKESIEKIDISDIDFSDPALDKTDNSMVVIMSDWHIGLKTNDYDYEIAKKRVREYADRVIHYAKLFGINQVRVIGIGDLVEGAYMRQQQSYEIEFPFSDQVTRATEIVNSFLIMLSEKLNVVYLGSILGNHSRLYDKGVVLSGDSAENIIDSSIKLFIKMLNKPRITVEDKKNSNFDIVFDVNGKIIKAVHGDLLKKTANDKLSKFIASDNIMYDLLLYGHFHHLSYVEENHNRSSIGSGCLQGSTEYSRQLGYDTVASQTVVIFEGDNVIPIKINLGL